MEGIENLKKEYICLEKNSIENIVVGDEINNK